jgi:hypothetical protein
MEFTKDAISVGSSTVFSVWATVNAGYIIGSNDTGSAGSRWYMKSAYSAIGRFDGGQNDGIFFASDDTDVRIVAQESTGGGNPLSAYLYRDGVLDASKIAYPYVDDTTRVSMRLGCRSSTGLDKDFADGYLAEVISVPNSGAVLPTAERQKIEGYLAWKWGLQGSLPVGHPYENNPPTL